MCDFALVSFNLTLGCRRCRRRSLATLGQQAGWTTHWAYAALHCGLFSCCCYYSTSLAPIPLSPHFLCLCWSRDNKQYFMAHQICNKLFRHSSKTIHHAANATCRSMQHLHVHPGSNCDSSSQLLLLRGHLPRLTAPMSASISQKTELTLELACGAALWSASEPCRLYWGANNWSELNKFCSTTLADCATHLCSQMETTQTDKNTKFSSCQYHVTTVITVLCRHYIDTHTYIVYWASMLSRPQMRLTLRFWNIYVIISLSLVPNWIEPIVGL